ncbi:MAG: citrate synthase [Cyanobacteria bacterium REEB67]|nr:citrate synthase [Cyanobacteria bacterium REEB67]
MGKGGLEDVVAAQSAICDVDGTAGRLVYCGYDIHDLAEHSTFEEVIYLLWNGRLPSKSELATLTGQLQKNRALPKEVIEAMKKFPKEAMPMEALRTAVSMLSMYDPEAEEMSPEANLHKAVKLTAQIPTIVAYIDLIRNGKEVVVPKEEGSLAESFLYLLSGGKKPDETAIRSLDIALILHADHELNASTFAGRVAAATLTDFYSATVAAIGALKGPLHGGANQEVIKMLIEMGTVANVKPHLDKMYANHEKVMGFGHRVYKTEDPRATHLRKMSEELGKRSGDTKWFEMSRIIEESVKADKGLNANVDFYSASVYYMLGIPIDLYTPIFAISRMSGWAAHILEQYANNRLIRPRAEYTGKRDLKWVPFEKRQQLEAVK